MTDGSAERPTVLVVDDEPAVADAFAQGLAPEYETRTAHGGQAALAAIDDGVDAVLLDRRMPDRSGDEVLERLREEGYDCVVIMITAVDPDLNILEMDFDDYLCKPVSPTTIRETLDQHLEHAGQERLDEFFRLISKLAVLEEELTEAELRNHEEYRRLRERAQRLGDDLRDSVEDFEEIVETHREINRGA